MNWFAGIIANVINLVANGISALLNATIASSSHLTNTVMGNVILSGFFPDASKVPTLGAGGFSDMIDSHAQSTLNPFGMAFWVFGWTFFLVSVYLLVIGVSSAGESAVQRERLKKGIVSVLVASVLIWQGQHFAVMISQFAFYSSDYFLNLNPLIKWAPSNNGGQALLGSIVNLLQAILSIIVWIVYQFRWLILYVWMITYPLAMAFYANEKTRGIAKMWWTEWIYQMAIPVGQSLVFGVASAVANPSSGAALTASDIFVSLAGTIGLLASATYVRKVIDLVAQNFGATMMGANHGSAWGNMAMIGGAAMAGDMLGKASIKAGRATAGKGIGKAFNAFDNKYVKPKAEQAIQKRGEVHVGAITNGASMEDVMMAQKLGGQGDVLQNGGVGLDNAASGGTGMGGFRTMGSGRSSQTRGPVAPIIRSGTARELGNTYRSAKSALNNSHLGTWMQTSWKGFQNDGGIMGYAGDKVTPTLADANNSRIGRALGGGMVAGGAQRYMANRANHADRLETLRSHLRDTMDNNALALRLPGISEHYDATNNTFQGLMSPAEKAYSTASQSFVDTMQNSMNYTPQQASQVLQQAQQSWQSGKHLPNLRNYSPQVQQAYRSALSTYRPAQLDKQAKDAVIAGQLSITKPKVPDARKEQIAQIPAFLNDARNAIMYRGGMTPPQRQRASSQ